MPSFKSLVSVMAVGWVAVTNAAPALPSIDGELYARYETAKRQAAAAAATSGLTDVDILQFALTLENLETAFYEQGFAKFSDSDFAAAGLSATDLTNLKSIGQTEQVHITTLLTAIAGAGETPVQACTYNFGFTDAAAMLASAAVLENIGVSAYLGAAPLISSASILTVAAEILTVESRHQTFIRTALATSAVPSPFDTPLGVRSVFSLAASFISSCPSGSNLNIQPFAPITQGNPSNTAAAGDLLELSTSGSGATFCSFTNGGVSAAGSVFVPLVGGQCAVPQNLAGVVYVHLTSADSVEGVLTDDITVAGPMVIAVS